MTCTATLALDANGSPLGRVFDNQEHAVASIAAMADPKTLASMYMSGAKNESARHVHAAG